MKLRITVDVPNDAVFGFAAGAHSAGARIVEAYNRQVERRSEEITLADAEWECR